MRRKMLYFIALLVIPAVAVAAGVSASKTVTARQDNFKVMGKAMKAISDELKRPTPDVKVIRSNAGTLAVASQKVRNNFPAGSGPEAGVQTDALPAIWQRPTEFRASAQRLTDATRALQSASRSKPIPAIQAAVGAVGQSCKSCHDNFRKPRG